MVNNDCIIIAWFAPHVRESEFWNVSFQKISIPSQWMDKWNILRGDNTIREIFDSGIRNPELFLLLESGSSRNPEDTNDWHPVFKLYWQRVESDIWNPESTDGFPYKGRFHAWFSLTEHTYLLCIQVFRIHMDRRFDRYCVKQNEIAACIINGAVGKSLQRKAF